MDKLNSQRKLIDFSKCINSGKEANVYVGQLRSDVAFTSKFISSNQNSLSNEEEFAGKNFNNVDFEYIPCVLKIYRTSTMDFKNRSKYFFDERRFGKFSTSNSRKLIKIWAQKEVRNYNRLVKGNIPTANPLYLKNNILILEMLRNEDGTIAKRLDDFKLCEGKELWVDFYNQSLTLLHDIYNKAALIHADFSSYNLLVKNNKLYVIDVGQSIEKDAENSHHFLIMDIVNNNNFFKSRGVTVKDAKDIFISITNLKIPEYLNGVDLCKETFIPSCLRDVANVEDAKLFVERDEEDDVEDEDDMEDDEDDDDVEDDDVEKKVRHEIPFDLDHISLFERKPGKKHEKNIPKEQVRKVNKERKKIVKEMNKERRKEKALRDSLKKKQKKK